MKYIKSLIILFLLGLFFAAPMAQAQTPTPVERSKEIITVGGKQYYMHYVRQGQTLYGISNAYQVSIEEIERLNPELKDGLKAGNVIGIPVVKTVEPSAPVEPTVEPKPTVEKPVTPIPPQIVQPKEPEKEPEKELEKEPEVVTPSVPVVPEAPQPQPQPQPKPQPTSVVQVGGNYTVQAGEDLYDIAKKFGIDIADFKAVNPNLSYTPAVGTVIAVPNIVNENDYLVHKVEFNERTTSMLKRWKVSEDEFREMNISVGSHVFVNQVVLIPIDEVLRVESPEPEIPELVEVEEPVIIEEPESPFFEEEPEEVPECNASPENARKRYKVALMVPLYLYEAEGSSMTPERKNKARPLAFLQFYEGFVMAARKITDQKGMKLDLTVIDVTESVSSAQQAVEQIEGQDIDMIVGPFFSKAFSVVESYAKDKDIILVNPLTRRDSITTGNPNVIKVKPGGYGRILEMASLVKNHYNNANVFILSKEKDEDIPYLDLLEEQLNKVVNNEVVISNEDFLEYARKESRRMEMGNKTVATIDVEGQTYSTSDLENGTVKDVVLANPVKRYSNRNIGGLRSELSGVRDNVIFAYGNDNVFATQILNSLKSSANRYPITLVAMTDWSKLEKLLVENLLQMNAIYVSDFFVDYNDPDVKRFVLDFRRKYGCEPQNYAFEGYDVGWYFLNALMNYGTDMVDCLPYYDIPLFHTHYYFAKKGRGNGLENLYWSTCQYDKSDIELKPINPFKKP